LSIFLLITEEPPVRPKEAAPAVARYRYFAEQLKQAD